jgi:hypothetical protein
VLQPPVRDSLAAYLARNTQRNLARLAELRRLVADLDAAGIRCIPFRGLTLAGTAYDQLGQREFADIDLIVPRDRLLDAAARIGAAGYELFVGPAQLPDVVASQHAVALTRAADDMRIELHWTVSPRYIGTTRSFDDLWPHVVTGQVAGLPLPMLSPRALLPALCEHGAKHFWDRLAWIADLDGVIRATPDPPWNCWAEDAAAHGQLRALQLGLDLARRLLDTPVPDVSRALMPSRAVRRISDQAVRRLPTPDDAPGALARARFGWATQDRLTDRVRYLWRGLTTLTVADANPHGRRLGTYARRMRRLLR